MELNFSTFNVEYFLAVRESYKENPPVASALFHTAPEFLESVAQLTPHHLANLVHVTVPLVVPRREQTWWPRLLRALTDGDRSELIALSEEAGFYLIHSQNEGDTEWDLPGTLRNRE